MGWTVRLRLSAITDHWTVTRSDGAYVVPRTEIVSSMLHEAEM